MMKKQSCLLSQGQQWRSTSCCEEKEEGRAFREKSGRSSECQGKHTQLAFGWLSKEEVESGGGNLCFELELRRARNGFKSQWCRSMSSCLESFSVFVSSKRLGCFPVCLLLLLTVTYINTFSAVSLPSSVPSL